MPALSDLFNITPGAISTAPQRMRNLPPPPVKPEWDIRSGLPEPGLEQVTPEEWLPPGAGMKLAALAKGGIAPLAVGIMKNRGGMWKESSLPHYLVKDSFPKVPYDDMERIKGILSPEQFAELGARRNINLSELNNFGRETWDSVLVSDAIKGHLKDPSYLPHLQEDPYVASTRWTRGPLRNYITRDMATEGDPIRALAEQGITHLPDKSTKRLPNISKYRTALDRVDQGFPAEETASTRLGKIWERLADVSTVPGPKNEYGDIVYQYAGLSHPLDNHLYDLTNIIKEGIRRGAIDPGSVNRGNFTVEAAVRYADKLKKDAAKNRTSLDVFKEYPETGHKWVQLNKSGQFAAESDAMGHSVRGYEPPELGLGGSLSYGGGGFPAIESGKAKIFSLRTPSGKPAVTAEVLQNPDGTYRISQIRGHSNSPPKPEYDQMIEDLKRQFEQ